MEISLLLGYTGAYRDPITRGYPLGNGYRTFMPASMRFNSPDFLSPFGRGGINPYSYCTGDPINYSDPSGHSGEVGAAMSELEKRWNEDDDTPRNSEAIAAVHAQDASAREPSSPVGSSAAVRPPHPDREWGHAMARPRDARLAAFGTDERHFIRAGRKMDRRGAEHLAEHRMIKGKVANLTAMTSGLENRLAALESGLSDRGVLPQAGTVNQPLDAADLERALELQSLVTRTKRLFNGVDTLRRNSLLRDVRSYKQTMAGLQPRLDRVDNVVSRLVERNGELDDVDISDDE